MPKITESQRKKAIREYHREYRKNNPEKIKKIRDRYWDNVFRKMKEKSIWQIKKNFVVYLYWNLCKCLNCSLWVGGGSGRRYCSLRLSLAD